MFTCIDEGYLATLAQRQKCVLGDYPLLADLLTDLLTDFSANKCLYFRGTENVVILHHGPSDLETEFARSLELYVVKKLIAGGFIGKLRVGFFVAVEIRLHMLTILLAVLDVKFIVVG